MRRAGIALLAALFVLGLTTPAGAADPVGAEFKVFTDPPSDGAPVPEVTPPWQDLTAGYIVETADEIRFTWEVVYLPDPYAGNLPSYHWEFAIYNPTAGTFVPCGEPGNRCFSIRATIKADGSAVGGVDSNCSGSPVVTCERIPAEVVVTYDTSANQATAALKLADIGNPQAGEYLVDVVLFRGIAAFTNLGVPGALPPGTIPPDVPVGTSYVCSCAMDTAVLDDPYYYEIGSHRT